MSLSWSCWPGPLHSLLCLAKTPSVLERLTISPRAWVLPGSMLRLIAALLPTLLSAMRSRRHLVIENLALRQRPVTLAGRRHSDIRRADRVFWLLLHRLWSRWAETLAIVRPDTVNSRLELTGFRGAFTACGFKGTRLTKEMAPGWPSRSACEFREA
jgi:hypothetical protein